MFLGVLDPDPLVRGMDQDPDPSIIKPKVVRKTLFSTVFGDFFYFLPLKTDVKVPSKSSMRKNFLQHSFFVGVLKVNDENRRIRIRIH
jgi:hypothetical protein